MRRRKSVLLAAILLAGVAAGAVYAESPPEGIAVKVTPAVIPMGTFYSGAKVHVEGTVPPGSDVVIAVRGPDTIEVFNKVGRAGPIWVNVGKVSISGIPSVLLIFSSKRVCDCLCRAEVDRHVLDAAAIKGQIKIKPQASATDLVADEFLKLKYRQGSYQLENVGVRVAEAKEEGQGYSLDFDWPRNAAPGMYRVSVSACRDGNVIHSQEIPLEVAEIGFPAAIAGMARERPATYGIISVVAAVLAGFGIDFITTKIFKKKIASSH